MININMKLVQNLMMELCQGGPVEYLGNYRWVFHNTHSFTFILDMDLQKLSGAARLEPILLVVHAPLSLKYITMRGGINPHSVKYLNKKPKALFHSFRYAPKLSRGYAFNMSEVEGYVREYFKKFKSDCEGPFLDLSNASALLEYLRGENILLNNCPTDVEMLLESLAMNDKQEFVKKFQDLKTPYLRSVFDYIIQHWPQTV